MKPREAYVRVEAARRGPTGEVAFEAVLGLEFRDGDALQRLYAGALLVVQAAIHDLPLSADDMAIAEAVENELKVSWPDRAYFIEVGRDPHDCWVQVFQPWGVPRSA